MVLGLSGGIDSALVAALAAEALGPAQVLGVLMPSPYSSSHSVTDALALAKNLGLEHRLIPIDGPFRSFYHSSTRRANRRWTWLKRTCRPVSGAASLCLSATGKNGWS